jgi:hypothetical protein
MAYGKILILMISNIDIHLFILNDIDHFERSRFDFIYLLV